ncbi:unnamed protein product [Symbiodinium microadriaticum]|nr:unnamed protein product [Symbiodinium microadriaticum]CAE7943070.1 unnamed protein product [Symbiodinium sp. KB8]
MSYTRAETEDLLVRLERSLQRHADATVGVRRKAAETEVLKELGAARDLLSKAARGDRALLEDIFGGSCEYFWRYQNALDRVQLSEEHAQDPRLGELRAGLQTAKSVLQDVGSFKVWLLEMTAPTELSYEGLGTWPVESVNMEPVLQGCNKATVRFLATPSLPSCLKLDRTSGEISGAVQEPEDDAWAQPYTIIASNAAGMASIDVNFSGRTLPPKIMKYAGVSAETAQCQIGQKVCWLPKAAGGLCSWSVQPQLPEGLWIDEESGCIFGSPAAPAEHGIYTVVATNAGGSDSFTIEFSVEGGRKTTETVTEASAPAANCLSCDGLGCGLCSRRRAEEALRELQRPALVSQLEWRKERRSEHRDWTSHSFLHALLDDGRTMRIQRFEGSDDFVTWFWPGEQAAEGTIYKDRVARVADLKPKLTSTELQDVAQMKASCDYDTAYHNCHHFARDVWNAVVVASLQCTHYPDRLKVGLLRGASMPLRAAARGYEKASARLQLAEEVRQNDRSQVPGAFSDSE